MPSSRETASGSSPSPAVQRRARRPNSPRGTLLLCREERALGQTVFVQCVNEVVARCSLFTGILFVHPGLKHSYEIRTATLAWEMLFEQLGSVRVDGHAAVFGCLSQAVSEFPVQIERHVHLSTSLQGRPGGPLLVHAGGTPIKTTTVDNSPGSDPSAGKDRYHCTAPNACSRPDASETGTTRWPFSESAGLVRLTAGCAGWGQTARLPRRSGHDLGERPRSSARPGADGASPPTGPATRPCGVAGWSVGR